MYELIISGGLLANPEHGTLRAGDLAVHDGRIAQTGPVGTLRGLEFVDATGLLVTPGLIDPHTHVYPDQTRLGVTADTVGLEQGVTTVADAGSCGSDHWPHFSEHVTAPARTRVLSWLNVSRHGLVRGHHELAGGPRDIDAAATAGTLGRADGPIGVKVRMSESVLGDSGLAPLRTARELASAHGLPVMVHIGNVPPTLGEVLDLLVAGDVVTHALHGKPGGLFTTSGPRPEVWRALDRGVRFDVGHGSSSFAFHVAERALAAGIRPYTAGTDLHSRNIDGPVHSMTSTLSKLLALGMPLIEVLACATLHAADVLGQQGRLGTLRNGSLADLSLLRLSEEPVTLTDAIGEHRTTERFLTPYGAVRAGRPHLVRPTPPSEEATA